MIKQLLISSLPLFTIAFLLTGCEQTKSAPEKKNQVEESAPEKKPSSINTTAKMKAVEMPEDQIISATAEEPVATNDQQFEGSRSLKRYLDESP